MSTPAPKNKPYKERLTNRFLLIPEEELLAYIADLQPDAESTKNPPAYRAYCLHLWGLALARLDDATGALSKHRHAQLLAPSQDGMMLLGVRLLELDRAEEAVRHLAEAADMAPDLLAAANLASGLARLGAHPEALATYQDAVGLANLASADDLFTLAQHAAELGLLAEASEFMARFLSVQKRFPLGEDRAVDVLRQYRHEFEPQLVKPFPKLLSALRRVMAFAEALEVPAEEAHLPTEGGLDMLEATRPMRALAAAEHGGPSS